MVRVGDIDRRLADEVEFAVPAAAVDVRCSGQQLAGIDPGSLIARLERRIQGIDTRLEDARQEHTGALTEAERARDRLGSGFDRAGPLERVRKRQAELNEALTRSIASDPALSADGGASPADAMAERLRRLPDAPTAPSPTLARTPGR